MAEPGEHNLHTLLRTLAPELAAEVYWFCCLPAAEERRDALEAAWAVIREAEAITLIMPRAHAEIYGLSATLDLARITLRVHSALDAVGLTAAVSRALTERGISANMIAGFYHDHLFVPWAMRELALATLHDLSTAAQA